MDSDRKRIMVILAVGLLVFGVYQFAVDPWISTMKTAQASIVTVETQVRTAETVLLGEKKIEGDWKRVGEQMARRPLGEAANQFTGYLDGLTDSLSLTKTNFKPDPASRAVAGTAFKEHAVDMTFQCGWEAFVKFLLEINNSDEFVRIQRIGVTSQFTKESHMDVSIRVSTIAGGVAK